MEPIIRVEHLGKRYRIGVPEPEPTTRTEALNRFIKSPFEYLQRNLRPPTQAETLWALRDINFQVKQGEVLGIIGRNGAGKSTLLKILSRLTDPTEGFAALHGRVGSLLEVGTGFHADLTGRENIYLSGTILGMKKSEIDRKLDEIVAFSEVGRFLDTPVKRYSSGMSVRLGFAVAAHLEPEILIVDEVLAVGDIAFQRKCLGKMETVSGEGRTILFVSHAMNTVQTLCQRVILIEDGHLTRSGLPSEIINQYEKNFLPGGAGKIDLREHENRLTDKRLLTQLRLLNPDGEETTRFQFGEKITFEITLDVGAETMVNPLIYLSINRHGGMLVSLTTNVMIKETFKVKNEIVARCEWDPGWLSPGTFLVNRIGIKRQSGGERIDHIENVVQFEIVGTDLYGTGQQLKEETFLLPKGRWEIWTDGSPDTTPPQVVSKFKASVQAQLSA